MHGICFDYDLQDWFDFKIPKTKISPDFIENSLLEDNLFAVKPSAKIVWIGGKPQVEAFVKSKKGSSWEMIKLTFHDKRQTFDISLEKEKALWLVEFLEKATVQNDRKLTFSQMKESFEQQFEDFELFWFSKPIEILKENGLLSL